MKPSERAVSSTPVPLASMARRAARTRSTARSRSKSGASGSPVESSIDNPAMPVVDGPADVGRHAVGVDGEAALEVGVHGHVHGGGHGGEVREHHFERHVVVTPAEGPGKAGAGRGEGREAECGQDARAAGVPRVGHHEAARRVQGVEGANPGDGRSGNRQASGTCPGYCSSSARSVRAGWRIDANSLSRSASKAALSRAGTGSPGGRFWCSVIGFT